MRFMLGTMISLGLTLTMASSGSTADNHECKVMGVKKVIAKSTPCPTDLLTVLQTKTFEKKVHKKVRDGKLVLDADGKPVMVVEVDGFTIIAGAIRAAGLQESLSNQEKAITLLLPTDSSLDKSAREKISGLVAAGAGETAEAKEGRLQQLRNFLLSHLVEEPMPIQAIGNANGKVRNMAGGWTYYYFIGGKRNVGNQNGSGDWNLTGRVEREDIMASNGVLHVTNGLLF